jgi:hypothetical protein
LLQGLATLGMPGWHTAFGAASEGGVCGLALRRLGRDVWWAEAAAGEADAGNRGFVAHLLALRSAGRLWLIGSGPSPAFGARLACALQAAVGQAVDEVITPWAHPGTVLGNTAFPTAGLWAHAEVAQALQQQCPHCIARLQDALGPAAGDLGAAPLRLPTQLLRGEQGTLAGGALRWWRVQRGPASVATLWAVPQARLLFAPGLLWTGAAPDLVDTSIATMQRATAALQGRLPAGWHVLGQQGPLGSATDLQVQAHYLATLTSALRRRQAEGALETAAPPPLPGVAAAWLASTRHALNWQRGWRELEPDSLPPPAAPAASTPR